MELIAGFVLGFLLGLCIMAAVWNSSEKKDLKRGFTMINDNFYRLTPISYWSLCKDELWHEVWDKEEKL